MAEDPDDQYAEERLQDFLTDRWGRILPEDRIDKSETWDTYRLLGIKINKFGHNYISADWPDGWHKVRAGETKWHFELRDADGIAMVTGMLLEYPGDRHSSFYMQLTDAGRRIVRRRYQAMPTWQQHLLAAKGGAWKPKFPSMRRSEPFYSHERKRLPIIVARMRALGWEIGEERPEGIEILLSDQAAAWSEERAAGDRFWLIPSGGGTSLSYGVCAGDEYPWCQWDLQTPWAGQASHPSGPSDIATELDQILRRGLPPGLTTVPVLVHRRAERRTNERADAPPEPTEVEVRDSLTLWDKPLVDPRKVWWKHQLVLESHPDLPPPSGKLPRWQRHVPLPKFSPGQYEPGLWEIARRYRDCYFLPRTLTEEHQELLRRARAAARAIEDAPLQIRDELRLRAYQAEPLNDRSLPLLGERLLQLARTLEAAAADPAFDAETDCEPFIQVLEGLAAEGFDMVLRQAEVVEVVTAAELNLWQQTAVAHRNQQDVVFEGSVERVICDCGKSRWLVIFIGRHGAIGCTCGRLRWEDRLVRDDIEKAHPGTLTSFGPPFDLDALVEGFGFGPFRHQW